MDGDLELALTEKRPGRPEIGYVPSYRFEMRLNANEEKVGNAELRVGNAEHIVMYGGHIAYEVLPEHRGHRYAARACILLFPLARGHGLRVVWITCNLENFASARTCELVGGEFVEVVDLPPDTDMYRKGERRKRRYRFEL